MPVDRSHLSNAFEFVSVASARARQLQSGCRPRVEDAGGKVARTAQREVLAGAVHAVEPEGAAPGGDEQVPGAGSQVPGRPA
jgi:DNA-directed RNA polymerase subunit K/omega